MFSNETGARSECQRSGSDFLTAEILGGIIRSRLVYAFLSAIGDVRYIGMSRVGVERPLHRLHAAHSDLRSDDRLQVWTFPRLTRPRWR